MSFEFNERFLVELNEYVYSCIYGQFLGNCDKDRKVWLNNLAIIFNEFLGFTYYSENRIFVDICGFPIGRLFESIL